jgi:hypothetical protein
MLARHEVIGLLVLDLGLAPLLGRRRPRVDVW